LTATFTPLRALFVGTSLFVTGIGLLTTALALRATAAGFSVLLTGAIMAAYFAGFVVGTLLGPHIVRRAGHVRAFSAFAATAAAALLLHPLLPHPLMWALLRFITGVCAVGLYMVIESWINTRATNETRGRAFAIYTIVSLASLGVGQYLILVGDALPAAPYLIAGALFSAGLVPVVLTRVAEPAPVSTVKLDLRRLWTISPLGVTGTFVTALANGALFGLGPVFAQTSGLSEGAIALFMSAALFGGVALQWPIGHLSDHWDRRTVLLLASAAGALLAFAGFAFGPLHAALLLAVMFLYGGVTSSLYPLCVAHSNDYVGTQDAVATASGLLLVYGAGATVGPLVVGAAMQMRGPEAFWLALMVMLAMLAAFIVVRMGARTAQPVQEPFVMLPRTSQAALEVLVGEARHDEERYDEPHHDERR
jgi:MFS family permease